MQLEDVLERGICLKKFVEDNFIHIKFWNDENNIFKEMDNVNTSEGEADYQSKRDISNKSEVPKSWQLWGTRVRLIEWVGKKLLFILSKVGNIHRLIRYY